MLKNTLLALTGSVAVGMSFAGSAEAVILTFNNRSAWEAAVGSFTVQDFNAFEGAQTEGAGVDVGDFTVRQVGTDFGGIFSEISTQVATIQNAVDNNLDGSAAVGGATDSGGTGIRFSFDTAISAWGADLGGFSDGGRQSAVIAGASYNIAPGQGFFGFLDTVGTTSTVDIAYVSGFPDGVGLDNVSYSSSASVPEPSSTLSLLALTTLGVASTLKRKLKSSKSTGKETTKVG
ncbi:MAG: PEP-CTERM sorting domain-containing protein [Microcystis sp.]